MKTATQSFSEIIAADVTGFTAVEIADAVSDQPTMATGIKGIDIAAIIALVETIMEIVASISEKCPNNQRAKREAINKPSRMQKVLTRLEVSRISRRNGIPDGQSGRISDALIKRAAMATDIEVTAVLNETEAVDNWI